MSALSSWLSEPQSMFSPVIFESFTQTNSPLSLASKYNTPETVQVFYEVHGNQTEVIIFDEVGSLFTYTTGFSSDQHFIAHTFRFLRAVMERQELGKMELMDSDLSRDEVEFFEIFTDFRKNKLTANKQDIFHHIERESFVEIMAILDITTAGATTYRIFCDDKEFSQLEFGSQLYKAVATHMQNLRSSSGSNYPIYLTDIDLSGMQIANNASSELQVSQYLHYKHEIEMSINTELNLLN
jgi:adenylate cyclase class 1